jgi:carbonic anhydrase
VVTAMQNRKLGLADNWLRHVQDVMQRYDLLLSQINDEERRLNKLCELNVIEQALNVSRTTVVQNAWDRGQELAVHGWIYGIGDGLLRDLDICITNQTELSLACEKPVPAVKLTQQ